MTGIDDRFVDIEITLGKANTALDKANTAPGKANADCWTAEVCWTRPGQNADVRRPARAGPVFDFAALRRSWSDPAEQGALLTGSLFGVPEVREEFIRARAFAESENVPLRLRLNVASDAGPLHDLIWETMRHPDRPDQSLVMDGRVLFSRYLSSRHPPPIPDERPKSWLRALVAIANPTGEPLQRPGERGLTPINVDEELRRAKQGLSAFRTTELPSAGTASLPGLMQALQEEPDIVVLICHGSFSDEDEPEPVLLLEDADGAAAPVRGSELVEQMGGLATLPSLFVLVSCQSAGPGGAADPDGRNDQQALAALGPQLAAAGVPAVLAMQGNVSMATMERFLPAFYRELQRHGIVDQAVAVARRAVRERPDWWMPVLFTRLHSGRVPVNLDRFGKWPSLLQQINSGHCVAILGPAVADGMLPSRQEIAARWAKEHHLPMATKDREDLAHVAQWLAVTLDLAYPGTRLVGAFRAALRAQRDQAEPRNQAEPRDHAKPAAPGDAPARGERAPGEGDLTQLVRQVGACRRATDPAEPHKLLAELPLKFYLTTHPAGFLEDALVERGKEPAVAWCRWREESGSWPVEDAYQRDASYEPDADHPVVFHLFGWLGNTASLVLTEDDYLDYMIAISGQRHLVPDPIWSALAGSALLLLGFRMEDWDFRGLLRLILSLEGGGKRARYTHVAVQVDPEVTRTTDLEEIHRYVDQYFRAAGASVQITVYWGGVGEFLEELQRRLPGEVESW